MIARRAITVRSLLLPCVALTMATTAMASTFASAIPPTITIPWQFDTVTGDSYIEMTFGDGDHAVPARVSLDTGSNLFSVAGPGGVVTVDPARSVAPPVAPPWPTGLRVVANSTIVKHYGSGGFEAGMATGALHIMPDDAGSSTTPPNVTVAAMRSVEGGGFPVGGPHNLDGILGISFPDASVSRSGYCLNGATPRRSGPPYFAPTCDPPQTAGTDNFVPAVPLLQQLRAGGAVAHATITMSFEGSVADRTRHGTLTLGAEAPPAGAALVPLRKYYGQAYAVFYLVEVPAVFVGGERLPFNTSQLEGNSKTSGGRPPLGGWEVDSGTIYPALPPTPFAALLAALARQYRANNGTMDDAKLAALLATANACATLGKCPPWFGPPASIPCVNVSAGEAAGLPTVSFALGPAAARASAPARPQPRLDYPATDYLYPVLPAGGCVQLGFSAGPGFLGNLAMQGTTAWFDQDAKELAFMPLRGKT